jgi:hypothetical protein
VIEHGTPAGYTAGCHEECCRVAKNRDAKVRRTAEARGHQFQVDGAPSRRKIEALQCLGHSLAQIAREDLGTTQQALSKIISHDKIRATTAAKIDEAYRAREMVVPKGPYAERTRRRAKRFGFLPPLVYDDIDAGTFDLGMAAEIVANADRRRCLRCDVPMIPQSAHTAGHQPEGYAVHSGRGLCRSCYDAARAAGEFTEKLIPGKLTREEALEAWVEFRDRGETITQAALELGITQAALSAHLARARRDGDDRGRTTVPLEELDEPLLEEFEHLRFDYGYLEDIADRLGVTVWRLDSALRRARERGDERGELPLEMRRSA